MNLYNRNQKQRNFFNEKIDTYDDVHATFMNTKSVLAESLDSKTTKILDLGAGTGLELIHVFELFPNAEVTAVDITENMLAQLSKRPFASSVKSICGDFFEVDFGTNYDAVISTSALHHFTPEEKRVLYKKIYDCLKPNGQFINCDKISQDSEEEQKHLYDLEHNIENFKHIDTPLTPETEIIILTETSFQEITSTPVDKNDYRLIKARKI